MVARLKRLRPISYRAREEHDGIARWLTAVRTCAARDVGLALEVARAGQLVKGYGDVRRRMLAVHETILTATLRAMEVEAARGAGFTGSTALAAQLRGLVLEGPDGEAQVPAAATTALASL
jgi:indolepyruvate ferredoxin oxidoreductase beta subunit